MVTGADVTGSPSSVPSLGVTVHVTTSPPENPSKGVLLLPAVTPLTFQSYVDSSGSPSASAKPSWLHSSESAGVAGFGDIDTVSMRGTALALVPVSVTA